MADWMAWMRLRNLSVRKHQEPTSQRRLGRPQPAWCVSLPVRWGRRPRAEGRGVRTVCPGRAAGPGKQALAQWTGKERACELRVGGVCVCVCVSRWGACVLGRHPTGVVPAQQLFLLGQMVVALWLVHVTRRDAA